MAELVDAHGSGPCDESRGGSSPLLGTNSLQKAPYSEQDAGLLLLGPSLDPPSGRRCGLSDALVGSAPLPHGPAAMISADHARQDFRFVALQICASFKASIAGKGVEHGNEALYPWFQLPAAIGG
jgi:hypothetical protein